MALLNTAGSFRLRASNQMSVAECRNASLGTHNAETRKLLSFLLRACERRRGDAGDQIESIPPPAAACVCGMCGVTGFRENHWENLLRGLLVRQNKTTEGSGR